MSATTEATVVVPTYKEAGNLRALTERLFKAVKATEWRDRVELLVVDDNSRDGSSELVEKLAAEGYPVRIIVRETERGLSSAVLRGFDEAADGSRYLVCMDADLQHPPEKVPAVLKALKDGASFVLGTRYAAGVAVDKDWPAHRRIMSTGARMLARPLSPLSDPMSGFFGIERRTYVHAVPAVSALGFKIALELFVKSHLKTCAEVPIDFGVRTAGESKLDGQVMIAYLLHLFDLYKYKYKWLPEMLVLLALVVVWFFFL